MNPSHLSRRRGFSLTELTVVLSIAGVILGGVWLIAGQVTNTGKIATLQANLATVVTNIRAYANGQPSISDLPASSLVPTLIAFNVFPTSMLRSTDTVNCFPTGASHVCADSPWGWYSPSVGTIDTNGTFQVCGWTLSSTGTAGGACGTTGTTQFFAITVEGLDNGTCLKLATNAGGSGSPPGLVDIVLNGQSMRNLSHAIPVTTTDASTYCTGASLANQVIYVYRLRAPQS